MKKALCFALVAAGAALGTWMLGWWSVPLIAFVAGLMRCGPAIVSVASAAGWAILLAVDAAAGSIASVAAVLAGVMGLPTVAIVALTIVLPALLGWSAASLGNAAVALRPTSRQPS